MIRNKLASLEAKLVRNYDRVTLLTGVKCRATSVAKKTLEKDFSCAEKFDIEHKKCICCGKFVFFSEKIDNFEWRNI